MASQANHVALLRCCMLEDIAKVRLDLSLFGRQKAYSYLFDMRGVDF